MQPSSGSANGECSRSEALARQLQQAEEQRVQDYYARQELLRADREHEQRERERASRRRTTEDAARPKKKDCVIM